MESPLVLLDQMQDLVNRLRESLNAPAPGRIIDVSAGGDLQGAIDAALGGDVIRLEASAVFAGTYVLPARAGDDVVTITGRDSLPDWRVTPFSAQAFPKVKGVVGGEPAFQTRPGAQGYVLRGLEIPENPGGYNDLIRLGDGGPDQYQPWGVPERLVIDRCYLHGGATVGQKRGIALNCGQATITGCYISDIKRVGQDSQAIAGWNGPGPYDLSNNYLEAAGENVLFGGSDPYIEGLIPSGIVIRDNYIAKPTAWRAQSWQVKNLLELKNANDVVIEGNRLENCWGAAQVGCAVLFNPRNQDGRAPWSTVRNVEFRENTVAHVAAVFNLLGTDYTNPSGRLQNVNIARNRFEAVDPFMYGGSDKVILVSGGPEDVSIFDNVISGSNLGSILYFGEGERAKRFGFYRNTYPASLYGIFGADSRAGVDGNGVPWAWSDHTDGLGQFDGNEQV
jgi:hypothetical protein